MVKVKYITYDVGTDYTGLSETIWGSEKEYFETHKTMEDALDAIEFETYSEEGQFVEVYIDDTLYKSYTKE